MESGKTAVVIIIVAMMLTAGVGYLLNFEKDTDTKTQYTPIGNMDALISANAGRSDESEVYNSIYNVTAWSPQTAVTFATLPNGQSNQYPYYPEALTSIGTATTTGDVSTLGYIKSASVETDTEVFPPIISGGAVPNPLVQPDSYFDGHNPIKTNLNRDSYAHGGYGQQTYWYIGYAPIHPSMQAYMDGYLYFNGDLIASWGDGGNALTWATLQEINPTINNQYINKLTNLPTVIVNFSTTTQRTVYDGYEHDDMTYYPVRYDISLTATILDDVADIEYKGSDTWEVHDSNGRILWTGNSASIGFVETEGLLEWDITTTYYQRTMPFYIDPTKYVTINEPASWSAYTRDASLSITELSFLMKGNGSVEIYDQASIQDMENSDPVGMITVTTTDSGLYQVTIGGVTVSIGSYIGLKITVSKLTNSIVVEGILSDNSADINTPTYNYTLSGFPMTIPKNFDIPVIGGLNFITYMGMPIQAYISETYILTDPNQVLWKDINVNIGQYFPQDVNAMRVLLQGFVRYGTSITVNNIPFEVEGNSIYVNGLRYNLNGLAIDYVGDHTYIVQTNSNLSVDLGPTVSTVLVMDGVWYFSTTASKISNVEVEVHIWNYGWNMDMNTTILTFVIFIFLALVILGMRFRDEIEPLDVIVLILTMVIAMSLLVIT